MLLCVNLLTGKVRFPHCWGKPSQPNHVLLLQRQKLAPYCWLAVSVDCVCPEVSEKIGHNFSCKAEYYEDQLVMLMCKRVDVPVFLWRTVALLRFLLSLKTNYWNRNKGKRRTNSSLIQRAFKSLRSGWLTWMGFHRHEGISTYRTETPSNS